MTEQPIITLTTDFGIKDPFVGIMKGVILEINPNHELFKTLEKVNENNPDKVKEYAKILYSQALLIEGLPLENPVEFSNLMVKLMVDANKE